MSNLASVEPSIAAATSEGARTAGRSEHAAVAEAAAPLTTDGDTVPLYRTLLPPAAALHYALQLGAATGNAELRWQPTLETYGLQLDGRVEGGPSLRQVSDGGFDIAGLAPLRHTEQRTRRGMLATNFQRDAGRISFSGSGLQLPLARGSQDRLSWIVQLAAVVAAEPERRSAGAVVAIPVAGLRGEAGVWRFRALAAEAGVRADPGIGPIRFLRERQGLYDVEVEIWLDPARHFMPARLVMRTASGASALELVLIDAVFGP